MIFRVSDTREAINKKLRALASGEGLELNLTASQIPNLPASKISSGTLSAARLPLATTTGAGAVIVGTGLTVTDGTVSVA